MPRYSLTPSFVISSDSFSEIDLLVTLFSKDIGKIKCIAKGAKKSKRRFMNTLEPFTFLMANLQIKGQGELYFLESATIQNSFEKLRTNYCSFLYGSLGLELVDLWCKEGQKDLEIFKLLYWYLNILCQSERQKLYAIIFKARLLKAVGILPKIDKCAKCNRTIKDLRLGYNIHTGQIYCQRCFNGLTDEKLSISTFKSLSYIFKNELDKITRLKISKQVANELWIYLKKRHCYALEREPKSYKLLK